MDENLGKRWNAIPTTDLLPDFFTKSQSFTPRQYYEEVIRICPELKKKWYETLPSEKKIQQMIIEQNSYDVIDGKESVPDAERILGISIDPHYKYPNGMSDLEYSVDEFYKYGLCNIFQKGNGRDHCFDRYSREEDGKIVTYISSKPSKEKAYEQAWRNLHYPDRNMLLKNMQDDWNELCELNPELSTIKFDKNNMASLAMARAGVTYGFPAKDIELFVQAHERNEGAIAFNHRERIKRELAEQGITDFTPEWVPSSETIKMMGEKVRAKKLKENTITKNLKDTMEKEAVKAGTNMGKVIEGAVSGIAKADNAVNQAIDTVIDKGSKALNNTSVGKAYEQVADAVSNTKVVKAVEKATAEAGEKVAKTAVGKSVTKVVAKTAGAAVGRSVLKKIPVLSIGAGLYYAYDRIKDGDWKGACGEVASGALGCFPGLGTAASAAIDVGLAAKDISAAVNETKTTETTSEEKTTKETPNKNDIKNIIMQKRGLAETKAQTRVQSSPQQVNLQIQQRLSERGRG